MREPSWSRRVDAAATKGGTTVIVHSRMARWIGAVSIAVALPGAIWLAGDDATGAAPSSSSAAAADLAGVAEVAAPVGDAAANDILLVSIDYDGSGDDRDSAEARFAAIGWCLVDFHRDGAGTRALVSLVGVPDEDALTLKAREAVPHLQALALVGGHARAYASAPTGEDAA